MPDAAAKYAIASPNIVHETFEDEVVVVSLDSGSYYSLEGSGTKCWDFALAGFSINEIVESLCLAYQVERSVVETSVDRFMNDTLKEGLLVIDSHPDPQPSENVRKPHNLFLSEAENAPFHPPRLVRYDEMRQLLLIDPVHMVGDAGWPQSPTEPPSDREDG